MPGLLRDFAQDIESWAEKLGCNRDLHSDAFNSRHDLLDWPDHSPLVLEVSGSEGAYQLESIRVEGRVVHGYLKDHLWKDAEDYICELNASATGWNAEHRYHNKPELL